MENVVHNIMFEMVEYFSTDVKRINHALKVYGFALNIAQREHVPDDQYFTLAVASVLHDIGIKESERKYHSSAGRYQEIEGPPIVREFLKKYDLEAQWVERVCFLVGNHHTYNNIDGIDFQILVEADFLVNIFEDDMNEEQIQSIKEKYFKTKTGMDYLRSMYGVNNGD